MQATVLFSLSVSDKGGLVRIVSMATAAPFALSHVDGLLLSIKEIVAVERPNVSGEEAGEVDTRQETALRDCAVQELNTFENHADMCFIHGRH
jgi:hypothetical protein